MTVHAEDMTFQELKTTIDPLYNRWIDPATK